MVSPAIRFLLYGVPIAIELTVISDSPSTRLAAVAVRVYVWLVIAFLIVDSASGVYSRATDSESRAV